MRESREINRERERGMRLHVLETEFILSTLTKAWQNNTHEHLAVIWPARGTGHPFAHDAPASSSQRYHV